jgi:hypothetical protein
VPSSPLNSPRIIYRLKLAPLTEGGGRRGRQVKSHDKTFPRLDMVRKMTSLLIIVRNPLDNFVSDLLDRNRVFVDRALRRLANSTIPVKFTAPDLGRLRLPVVIPAKVRPTEAVELDRVAAGPKARTTSANHRERFLARMRSSCGGGAGEAQKWVPLIWVSYLNLWLFGNGHATCQTGKGRLLKKRRCKIPRVPTYVIRFEDLQRDPSAIMVDFLQSTGIASALNLTSERVRRAAVPQCASSVLVPATTDAPLRRRLTTLAPIACVRA